MKETETELRAELIKTLKSDLLIARMHAGLIEERAAARARSWAPTDDARELARRKKAEYNTRARLKAARMEGGRILATLREVEHGSSAEIAARVKAAADLDETLLREL